MPNLIIIAGCNGAGKSTFSSSFLPEGLISFDYDRLNLEYYNSLPDSELRETIARNQTTNDFELFINKALLNKADFCYETNFDSHPLTWAKKFRTAGRGDCSNETINREVVYHLNCFLKERLNKTVN